MRQIRLFCTGAKRLAFVQIQTLQDQTEHLVLVLFHLKAPGGGAALNQHGFNSLLESRVQTAPRPPGYPLIPIIGILPMTISPARIDDEFGVWARPADADD